MIKFLQTSAETIASENPKTLKLTVENGMTMKNFSELWSVIYHEKGLAKGYSKVVFSKKLTETITIKNLQCGICQWIFFDNYDI